MQEKIKKTKNEIKTLKKNEENYIETIKAMAIENE